MGRSPRKTGEYQSVLVEAGELHKCTILHNGGNHAPMNAIAASSMNGSIFCHDKRVKMIVKMISLVETEGRKDRNDRKVETDTQ